MMSPIAKMCGTFVCSFATGILPFALSCGWRRGRAHAVRALHAAVAHIISCARGPPAAARQPWHTSRHHSDTAAPVIALQRLLALQQRSRSQPHTRLYRRALAQAAPGSSGQRVHHPGHAMRATRTARAACATHAAVVAARTLTPAASRPMPVVQTSRPVANMTVSNSSDAVVPSLYCHVTFFFSPTFSMLDGTAPSMNGMPISSMYVLICPAIC
mmetsp:Transcript_71675/g.215417  ORF Transcript_71675/g.215417 Transcript_71675/m.215417 type:complete len:215 (-) Transcript_71675:765-1409(-)